MVEPLWARGCRPREDRPSNLARLCISKGRPDRRLVPSRLRSWWECHGPNIGIVRSGAEAIDHAFDRHAGQDRVDGTPGARARLAVMRSELFCPPSPADPRCQHRPGSSRANIRVVRSRAGQRHRVVARNATTRPLGLTASSRARRPRPEVRRGGGESDGRTPRGRAGRDPA